MKKTIGILGGGQLGRMLFQASIPHPVELHFLDKELAPITQITPNIEIGDFRVYEDVMGFAKNKTALSIEIENVNTMALKKIEQSGKVVIIPKVDQLSTIKDKGTQKQLFKRLKLPTAPFQLVEGIKEIQSLLKSEKLKLPFVQKLRIGGYDGQGVQIISRPEDINKCFDAPSVLEEKANINKELSLILTRNAQGNIAYFPISEMVFNPIANLVDYVLAPADIDKETKSRILQLGKKLVESWDYIGILAIELFLNKDQNLWINEIAPRTHNSGHWTIEACHTSQFEQHLRVIAELPLGNNAMRIPYATMLNLVGAADSKEGEPQYENIKLAYEMTGAHVHLYGKNIVRPYRKMGHITLTGNNKEQLIQNTMLLKSKIKVYGK